MAIRQVPACGRPDERGFDIRTGGQRHGELLSGRGGILRRNARNGFGERHRVPLAGIDYFNQNFVGYRGTK